jgi:hypothetical protein
VMKDIKSKIKTKRKFWLQHDVYTGAKIANRTPSSRLPLFILFYPFSLPSPSDLTPDVAERCWQLVSRRKMERDVREPPREKGKKRNKDEDEGRRASGTLPPLRDLNLHPLPPSLSTSRLVSSKPMDTNLSPQLPLPLSGDDQFFLHTTPGIPTTPPNQPPSSPSLSFIPPAPPPVPSIPVPYPSSPPGLVAPPEVVEIANKFNNEPKLLLEPQTCLDELTQLLSNIHLLAGVCS